MKKTLSKPLTIEKKETVLSSISQTIPISILTIKHIKKYFHKVISKNKTL